MKKIVLFILSLFLLNSISGQNYVPFVKDSLWGIATWEGKVVFEPTWEELKPAYFYSMTENGFFNFKTTSGKIELVHAPSKKIFKGLNEIRRLGNSGLKLRKGNYDGFINKAGKQIIPFRYENINQNKISGHFILTNHQLKSAIFKQGDSLPNTFPYEGSRSLYFTDSMETGFIAKSGKKWGYLNEKLEPIIPFNFDVLLPLTLYGGNKVLFFKAKKLNNSGRGLFSLLDSKGKEIVSANYKDIKAFSTDVIGVAMPNNAGWQLLSSNGDAISDDSLRSVKFIPKRGMNPIDLIEVYNQFGKRLYFNKEGIEIELEKADELIKISRESQESLRLISLGKIISKNKKKGFVSNEGDTILRVKYDVVRMLGDCFVTLDQTRAPHDRQELHSLTGEPFGVSGRTAQKIYLEPGSYLFPVIEFTTLLPSYMRGTENDVPYQAFYRKEDGSQLLEGDFEEIYPDLVKEHATGDSQLFIKAKKDGFWGYWQENGIQVLAPKYEDIKSLLGSKLFIVTLDGEQFVINSEGKVY